MKTSIAPYLLLIAVSVVGACASSDTRDEEPLAESAAAITLPGMIPIPKGWDASYDGSSVDLMIADALVSCSWQNSTTLVDMGTIKDNHMSAIHAHMESATCPGYASVPPLLRWYQQRNDPACNTSAGNGGATSIQLKKYYLPQAIPPGTYGVPAGTTIDYANAILRAPSVNLCIAQQLRSQSPGTAGGEALVLSSAEQRFLLEVTRERAQLAMLGFAQLGVVFTEMGGVGGYSTGLSPLAPLPLVMSWGHDTTHQAILNGMGADFAAAVQLHTIVTQEVAELFGRSASAREPRGGNAQTPAEETWGPGSWRQRTLASLFGGDPLATDVTDTTIPWTNPAGNTQPNVIVGGYGAEQWPDEFEQPFIKADVSRPQVRRLVALARQTDAFDFKTMSSPANLGCTIVDRPTTASRLYRAVEAGLRNATCFQQTGGVCATFTANSPPGVGQIGVPDPTSDYSSFLLWKEHGITPEHAILSTAYLSELIEPMCGYGDFAFGTRDLARGTIQASTPSSGTGIGWTHVSSNAAFAEHEPTQIQPLYGRFTQFRMADQVKLYARPWTQGFTSQVFQGQWGVASAADESKRLLGGAAALVATREALLVANTRLSTTNMTALLQIVHLKSSYFAHLSSMLPVVAGAVGDVGVTFRPSPATTATTESTSGGPVTVEVSSGQVKWLIDITMPVNHPWWSANGTYYGLAVFNDPNGGNLISHPQTSVYGRTAQTVLQAATMFTLSAGPSTVGLGTNLQLFHGSLLIPSTAGAWPTVTLVARRLVEGTWDSAILATNVRIRPNDMSSGYYMSPLGSLGVYGDRILRGLAANPSKPAYDGFGFPTDWVPATDPTLFGDADGADAAGHYLRRAKEAATDATAAVQKGFDAILQEVEGSAELTAAQKRGTELLKEEVNALCGAGNKKCDTSLYVGPVIEPLTGSACPPANPTSLHDMLNCIGERILRVAHSDFVIATPVKLAVNDPTVPPFSAYSGGSLKVMFTEEWGNVKQLRNAVKDVNAAVQTAQFHVNAFTTAMAGLVGQVQRDCSATRQQAAVEASKTDSEGGSVSASTGFASASVSAGYSWGTSTNPGPIIAQQQKCQDATAALPAQQASQILAMWESIAALMSQASRVDDAVKVLGENGAAIQYQMQNGNRAKANADLEASLLQQSQYTSFNLYRQYHSYDLWRAKAVLEDARRYAVAARRAIEAKYLVDLSTMNAPEPFVAAPSSWADQVYDYDLSLPASVGLSVGQAQAGGIYPSKLLDYVGNLERFVDGYAVSRPSASAHGDSDVITLLGPDTILVDPQADGYGFESTTQKNAWSFFCPSGNSGQWVGVTESVKADQACSGQPPTRARVVFSIDAWGRLNANGVVAPSAKRFNARWDRLAVNIVGSGVKDCIKASDPLACYSSAFIPYDLSHTGPSWATDYEGTWRMLGVPVGRIEQAKALSSEQWLDPVIKGWSEPYVQAVARQEFAERPLDGAYLLDLEVAPEVQLAQIERIQILMSSSYWVKQQ